MFGMHVELSNPCTSAAFSFSFRQLQGARTSGSSCFHSHRSSGWAADGQRIGVNACHSWGENLVLKTSNQVKHCHLEEFQVGNHQCQKMIYVSNVVFNQHYFSIQAITAALNGIPHVYVELLPLAQVQRMGSGSDSIWGQKKLLEPVCCMSNIFSVFHSSSTDSTCRQNKLLEPVCCMSNIFNFPQ